MPRPRSDAPDLPVQSRGVQPAPTLPPAAAARATQVALNEPNVSQQLLAASITTLQAESFSANATTPNLWSSFGGACLTAGNAATPGTSVPACAKNAPVDASGKGTLQLTAGAANQYGAAISKTVLPTANGLIVTFTDHAFHGSRPGADGLALFFTDAAKPFPTRVGYYGGYLGYAGAGVQPGLPNAYLGVGLDEYGGFSTFGGGPGRVPETIAVHGSAATAYQYLGGATNAAGKAASLAFALDTPTATTRPSTAPTIRATLTAAGALSVAIDRHNGSGFVVYYAQSIVGKGGQPAVPAHVYFGMSAATGSLYNVHQVSGLTITTAGGAPVSKTPIANPPQIVSANGSLTFNVSTQLNASSGHPQFLYNGGTVPPTLRLLPGDKLIVNLTNNLPKPAGGSGYTNNTNLHYHGLHVSPQAPGDDSIDMLAAPGQSLHYTLQIPKNHPTGLYWYHTHAHGEAERQTLSGMSGALVIDGIAASSPAVKNLTERILIARDAPPAGAPLPNADLSQVYAMNWAMQRGVGMHASRGPSSAATSATPSELHAQSNGQTRDPYAKIDPNYRRFVRSSVADSHCVAGTPEAAVKALTLNGQTQPSIRIAPGESQFWRVVNAGADTYLDLQVDNTTMKIIALDGVPLASGVGTPAAMSVSHWVLPPASRVEFVITGPPAGTTAYVRTNCFDPGSAGDPMPGAILASIDSSAAPAVASTGSGIAGARVALGTSPFRFNSAAAINAASVAATRTIFYSDQNTINGVAYDPAAPPQFYAQSGTVEEWTIQNNSSQVHTLHIHQVHFVVQAINGTTQSPQFVMDNVNVPAATASGPGTVKLRLDFTDPLIIGTFLLHCHILSHEDGGMMAKIRIGTAPPLSLSASSVTFANPKAALQKVTITGGKPAYSVTGCNGVADAAVSGATVSIVPAAAGSCVLTVADGSSPSITASLAVTVSGGPAVVTLTPAAVSFTSPAAAAQTVTIAGGTLPYTVAGCAGIATATIAKATLTVAPHATGTCSLVVSDAKNNQATLSVSINSAAGGSARDNLTFHQNAARTGWYQHETTLTAANVGSSNFGHVATLAAPAGMPTLGKVYAQPLYVTAETAADGKPHNLVIIAGAAGQVYAFDETTRAVVWHRSFTNPGAGIRQQLWGDSGCSDVNPDVGIIGTPVIDRARDALYVVVATMENGVAYTRLHAISLAGGGDKVAPTVIRGSVTLATGGTASISSLGNLNRAALLEANGNIYVALGSHCDQNARSVHGWVIAYSASTLQETGNLADITNADAGGQYFLGAPWMSGFGPAADAQGNVYFATGNGPFNGTTDFAMSIMKVPGNLNLAAASYFTPITAAADSNSDADLGSGGVMILPDQSGTKPHLLVAGGKCSASQPVCLKYILNRDAMGGQKAGNAGAVWSGNTGGGIWGGPAYFVDANGGQHVMYGALTDYNVNLSPVSLSVQSTTVGIGCFECRNSGSQPIVSSNGTQANSHVVWALRTPGNAGGPITLYAFAPLKMETPLFHATAGSWTQAPGTAWIAGALVSPLVANGRVYVPTDGSVSVFGLLH